MRKKNIWKISVYLYVFLALCTLASVQVQKLLLPQVEAVEAGPGTVNVEGTETPYDYTISCSVLEKSGEDYLVYFLQERDGRFGKEKYVMRLGIQVVAQDGVTAALAGPGYGKIVVRSDKLLSDGMRVLAPA